MSVTDNPAAGTAPGRTARGRTYQRIPLAIRLARRSVLRPSGCVEVTGQLRPDGYGEISDDGWPTQRVILTHRAAWIVARGEIPDGLCVLHHCDNPPCINPDHLFIGTRLDNNRDAVAKGRHHNQMKTHCVNGHPLAGENLLIRTVNGKPSRLCRTCRKAAVTRHKEKNQGTA